MALIPGHRTDTGEDQAGRREVTHDQFVIVGCLILTAASLVILAVVKWKDGAK